MTAPDSFDDAETRPAGSPRNPATSAGGIDAAPAGPPRPVDADAEAPAADTADSLLQDVLAELHSRTGHDFSGYKRATVVRRVARRIEVSAVGGLVAYLAFLRSDPGEAAALLQDLLISVTGFFRDPEAFETLEAHVPALFRDKGPGDAVRVWCTACATGEEAYSMAILLLEHARAIDAPPALQVFGCDLDEVALQVARAGLYPEAIAADVSPERLRRFFNRVPGGWQVRREVRETVLFAPRDLLRDPPFSRMDLVACRNLLIYLDRGAQARAIELFRFALKPGGLLFLGMSETVGDDAAPFTPVHTTHRLYRREFAQRAGVPLRSAPDGGAIERVARLHDRLQRASSPRRGVPAASRVPAPPVPSTNDDRPVGEALHFRLLARLAPNLLVVNRLNDIVHLSENATRFLQMREGDPTRNVLRLLHPALRVALADALLRAGDSGQTVAVACARVELPSGPTAVDLRVVPAGELAPGALLVIFATHDRDADGGTRAESPDRTAADAGLADELDRVRAVLRETVAQQEASTAEFASSNRELQAMNDELRDAGEELETGREELQSVNDELNSVNAELKNRVAELARTNADLHNLMNATRIATVFLGRRLEVMRYTPSAVPLFNLIPTDVGRPISDLNSRLDYPELDADAAQVLRTLVPVERQLREDRQWYLARALPYRTIDGDIGGVVLTFVDITERRRVEEALRESEERRAVVLAVSDAIGPLGDPRDVQQAAMRLLGEHLRVSRAFFFFVDAGDDGGQIHRIETDCRGDAALASCAGRYRVDDFADHALAVAGRGRTVQVDDVAATAGLSPGDRARYRALDVVAFLNVPVVRDERLVAGIGVHQSEPRAWTAAEIALIEEVAARTWAGLERVQAERARVEADTRLRESETRLRLAVEASDLATWEWKLDTDEVFWNARHFEMLGIVPHDGPVAPGDLFRRVHPGDRARIRAELDGAIRRESLFESEFRAVIDSGELRWISSYGRVVETDDAGKAVKVSGVMRDITARRGAEEALRRASEAQRASEATMRAMAENLPGGAVFIVDRSLRYQLAGGEALRTAGFCSEDVEGRTVAEVVGPELLPVYEPQYRKVLAGGSFAIEHESHGRQFASRGVPLRGAQGEVVAALAVSYDITERTTAEHAVRRSEERLRTLADAVPQIIWANDAGGTANYFNRRWHEYTGLSFDASHGPGWEAVVHPDDAPASRRRWRRVLRSGKEFDAEYRLRAADGSYRWFIGRTVPMRDAAGQVTGWFGTATDIDDLKTAEAALRMSEEQLRRAIENAPIPMIMQAEDGTVLQISDTWTALTGYGVADTPTFDAWISRADGSGAASVREHVHRLFTGEVGELETEIDVTTRDGDRRGWLLSASAPGALRDGRRFIVGMALDVTERRQAEAALRESRERLQLIVENAREYAIFAMDTDRRITSWNSGAETILGHTQDEAVGCMADMIFTLEDRAAGVPEEEAAQALAEGRANDERWHVRRDGSRFWGSGIVTAMHDAGGSPIGLVKIFRDQTAELLAKEALETSREQLRAALQDTEAARDEAERAGRAKDRFLAVLSHELRAPLTPLLLAAQLLARDKSLPAAVRNTLEIIERNVRLEAHLVDDLLDVTRIASGKVELVREATTLQRVVALAIEVSAADIDARGQRLTLSLAAGDDALFGDVKRLQQVFWNLLKNASKFSPTGGAIVIRSRFAAGRVVVDVQDSGVGFDFDAAERIFAAFEQGGADVTRQFGGLGLGLAIARASVEAHGGRISATSPGRGLGATFTVELPLAV